jgi:hypothetical protein
MYRKRTETEIQKEQTHANKNSSIVMETMYSSTLDKIVSLCTQQGTCKKPEHYHGKAQQTLVFNKVL